MPKFRRIDDHTAGWVNLAAKRMQKIQMANANYIGLMIKGLGEICPDCPVHLSTADMKAAYRQVALSNDNVPFALTCLYDPDTRDVGIHEMYGQPFGAGHAVPNFYRVAEWFARFVNRWFRLGVDHFFDDFWIVSTSAQAPTGLHCLVQAAELLGIIFDPGKTQEPTALAEVLGVLFDTTEVLTHRRLRLRNLLGSEIYARWWTAFSSPVASPAARRLASSGSLASCVALFTARSAAAPSTPSGRASMIPAPPIVLRPRSAPPFC